MDNSVSASTVPSYYARSRLFDVIAPKPGFYPIRVLWFQSKRGQEPGLMLELYSVSNKQLHLMNSATDPDSVRAYRAGPLISLSLLSFFLSLFVFVFMLIFDLPERRARGQTARGLVTAAIVAVATSAVITLMFERVFLVRMP